MASLFLQKLLQCRLLAFQSGNCLLLPEVTCIFLIGFRNIQYVSTSQHRSLDCWPEPTIPFLHSIRSREKMECLEKPILHPMVQHSTVTSPGFSKTVSYGHCFTASAIGNVTGFFHWLLMTKYCYSLQGCCYNTVQLTKS